MVRFESDKKMSFIPFPISRAVKSNEVYKETSAL